jgi:hypothetical protein
MHVFGVLVLIGLGYFTPQADAYETVTVSEGGSISGIVSFSGTPPPATAVEIDKDVQICGTGHREIQEVRLTGDRLGNAVAYLKEIASGKEFSPADSHLDQETCDFVPHLQVTKNKEKISIMSKDPLSHTVHAYEVANSERITIFNVAVPNQFFKFSQKVRLRKGNVVKVECDTHKFMHAWMMVLDHPYYSLVGKDGTFSISDVPPGTYQLAVWNPTLGEQVKEVKVEPKGETAANFEFHWDGSTVDQR